MMNNSHLNLDEVTQKDPRLRKKGLCATVQVIPELNAQFTPPMQKGEEGKRCVNATYASRPDIVVDTEGTNEMNTLGNFPPLTFDIPELIISGSEDSQSDEEQVQVEEFPVTSVTVCQFQPSDHKKGECDDSRGKVADQVLQSERSPTSKISSPSLTHQAKPCESTGLYDDLPKVSLLPKYEFPARGIADILRAVRNGETNFSFVADIAPRNTDDEGKGRKKKKKVNAPERQEKLGTKHGESQTPTCTKVADLQEIVQNAEFGVQQAKSRCSTTPLELRLRSKARLRKARRERIEGENVMNEVETRQKTARSEENEDESGKEKGISKYDGTGMTCNEGHTSWNRRNQEGCMADSSPVDERTREEITKRSKLIREGVFASHESESPIRDGTSCCVDEVSGESDIKEVKTESRQEDDDFTCMPMKKAERCKKDREAKKVSKKTRSLGRKVNEVEEENEPPPTELTDSNRILLKNSVLHLLFPVPDTFTCPRNGCYMKSRTMTTWTAMKRSIERHLECQHGIRTTKSAFWCQFCRKSAGGKPSAHKCLLGQSLRIETGEVLEHRCKQCNYSAPTRKGLWNHTLRHRRNTVKVRGNPDLIEPNTRSRSSKNDKRSGLESRSEQSEPEVTSEGEVSSETKKNTKKAEREEEHEAIKRTPKTREPVEEMVETERREVQQRVIDSNGEGSPVSRNIIVSTANEDCPDSEMRRGRVNGVRDNEEQVEEDEGEDDNKNTITCWRKEIQGITEGSNSDAKWEKFEDALREIRNRVYEIVKMPERKKEEKKVTSKKINVEDSKTIQKLYKNNRRRTMRLIMQGEGKHCDENPEVVAEHFRQLWTRRDVSQNTLGDSQIRDPVDLLEFCQPNVFRALKSCENTAPGPDRISYNHWKSVDPGAKVLTTIMNVCLKYKRIPEEWKETTTVLIPKGDKQESLEDWRPITLSNTIYKLFMKCLAQRVTQWIQAESVLSQCQKGFLPHDGVFEHNYVLETRLNRARTNKTKICIAWLDCANAFGSLPHSVLIGAASRAGAGEEFTELITNIYKNARTRVLTNGELTDEIPQESGIKQGCPLSGLLFNMSIDPVIRSVQGNDDGEHHILAYADDVVIIANSTAELQKRIDTTEEMLKSIGITLNENKSAALIYDPKSKERFGQDEIKVNEQPITSLKECDSYKFLGKPVGIGISSSLTTIKQFTDAGLQIMKSRLAPWQRLDALKAFFFPSTKFAMRTNQLRKEDWRYIDRVLRAEIKKTLSLPQEACNEYVYGAVEKGCVGIPEAAEESDLAHIDGAFKLLTSSDMIIRRMAINDLDATIQKRLRREVEEPDRVLFLNGHNEGDFRTSSNAISNIWTRARKASTRLKVEWDFEGSVPIVIYNETVIRHQHRHKVMAHIRSAKREERAAVLIDSKSQGKVLECAAKAKASVHFLREGRYTRFADWRFVHRARLNLVPLNGCRAWIRGNERLCRKGCRERIETLPHVLNHCMVHSRAMQHRHNAIAQRIARAAEWKHEIIAENEGVAEGGNVRPDLIVVKDNKAIIFEISCPFDNRYEAFQKCREQKTRKYTSLAEELRRKYNEVKIAVILVGALGSWDPANDRLLRLIMTESYLKRFRRLCVSDTIRWSRDIYVEHITGTRQYQDLPKRKNGSSLSRRNREQSNKSDDNYPLMPISESCTRNRLDGADNLCTEQMTELGIVIDEQVNDTSDVALLEVSCIGECDTETDTACEDKVKYLPDNTVSTTARRGSQRPGQPDEDDEQLQWCGEQSQCTDGGERLWCKNSEEQVSRDNEAIEHCIENDDPRKSD